MLTINKTTNFLLYLILLSPLLTAITHDKLGLQTFKFYLSFLIFAYGIIFFFKKIKMPDFTVMALFWLIYLLAMPWLVDDFRLWNSFGRIHRFSPLFMILIVIYNTKFDDQFIERTIKVFKVIAIITFIVSVIQFFSPGFFRGEAEYMANVYSIRRNSIFGYEHSALGLSFIPLLSVLIGYMIYKKERFLIYFIIMGGVTTFLSNSRFIMVAFFIISIQLILANRDKLEGVIKYIFLIGVFLLVSYLILQYLGYDLKKWKKNRLFKEGSIEETTRFKAINTFKMFFPQHPYFGNGFLADEEVVKVSRSIGSSQIHVGYLSHLVAYGIVGCFFLYGFWFLLLRRLSRVARKTTYWGSFFAFLSFLWAFATFCQSVFLYGGIIFGFVFDKYFADQYLENHSRLEQAGQYPST
jgi:hypothetical protein